MIDPTKISNEKLAEMNDALIADNQYLRAELTKATAELVEANDLIHCLQQEAACANKTFVTP